MSNIKSNAVQDHSFRETSKQKYYQRKTQKYRMIWSSGNDICNKSRYKHLPELIDLPIVVQESSTRLTLPKPLISKRQTFQQRLAQVASQFRITTVSQKRTNPIMHTHNDQRQQSSTIKKLQPLSRQRILLSKHQLSSINLYHKESLSRKLRPAFKSSFTKKIQVTSQDQLPSLAQETILNEFLFAVNLSNGMVVNNKRTFPFRAYIERGNNGNLVRTVLNRRWWWHSLEEPEGCNLLWSQWNRLEFAEMMDKNSKSGRQADHLPQKRDVVQTYSVNSKKSPIQKIVDLDNFEKLASKMTKDSEHYFTFGKKLKDGTSCNHATSLSPLSLNPLYSIQCHYHSRIHNHVEGGLNLHSKKLLLSNLKIFYESRSLDPFQNIPVTFHIKNTLQDDEFKDLFGFFDKIELKKELHPQSRRSKREHNVWICKPGENSNRGVGITVVKTKQNLLQQILSLQGASSKHTLIIQKYIEHPFLIQGRKFDIRCYILITTCNGIIKGYWYEDGYIRTASQQFTLDNVDNQMIHLTNDAVQKKGKDYGRFQNANKMSFIEFQDYLEKKSKFPKGKFAKSYAKIKSLAKDLIHSVYDKINPMRRQHQFQLFGLDFMLDQNLKPWLIEANSNPCLETSGPILNNVFRIAIDPLFPPPNDLKVGKTRMNARLDYFESNKFELLFDSADFFIKQAKEQLKKESKSEMLDKISQNSQII